MNKRFLGLLTISIAFLVALTVWAQTKAQTTQVSAIEQKARVIHDANDSQIRDLVNEVFRTHGLVSQDPGLLENAKDRLTRAEVNYRKGQQKPINEIDVVKAVNHVAEKFKAPQYAYTTQYEVRRVRVGMFAETPHLISQDVKPRKEAPKAFNPELSPIEAFHVAATLAQQKLVNPDYQLTCAERRAHWSEDHQRHTPRSLNSNRTNELHDLVRKHAAQMTLEDAQKQAGESLDLLGIER